MARYKVTKEQLERIVENFVMEAATTKAPVKNHIPSQGAEAKKHVKNKVTGRIVEPGEGVPTASTMKKKHSHAPEAKKHMSKGGVKHSNKAKVMKEEEEVVSKPNTQEVISHLKTALKGLDVEAIKQALAAKGIDSKEEAKQVATQAAKSVNTDNMEDYMDYEEDYMLGEESFLSKHKGKIALTLLAAGLTALGIKGELQSQVIDQMREDSILMSVLKDPMWVGGILSTISGIALAGSAISDEQKIAKEKAQKQIERQRMKMKK